jgi:hypothetical protein
MEVEEEGVEAWGQPQPVVGAAAKEGECAY